MIILTLCIKAHYIGLIYYIVFMDFKYINDHFSQKFLFHIMAFD